MDVLDNFYTDHSFVAWHWYKTTQDEGHS